MKRTDDRLIPVLLICVQALVWPGAALVRGTVPSASDLLVAALVAGPLTAALALRRARPVTTLVLVAVACGLGAGPLPTGAVAVSGTAGVALALFTVASERDTFTALLCVVALPFWQVTQDVTLHGLRDGDGLGVALTALLYAAACGSGLVARRARRARQTAERALRRAEAERHRLPAAERRRMERELHDVSAHHLTAVVVTAGAALGLRERRPELAQEALRFAAETGREVCRALGAVRAPTPSREELPTPEERLLALVAGFRRLDQPVDCAIDPLPEGVVADAAYGIVREALTNVARHAPGARTTVLCRYGDTRTDVVVTSAAPPAGAAAHAAGLGGGRGQGFLRSRAREAGGTLSTGPTADGGWEVRAALPGRGSGPVEASVPRGYRLAQVVAALGLSLQPLLPALVIRADTASSTASSTAHLTAGTLFALLAAAQAVALLWLRRTPRLALAALLALAPLWPVAMALGDYTGPVLLPPALSALATCTALTARAQARTAARPAPAGARRTTKLVSTDLPVSAGGSGDRVVPGGGSGERPVPGGAVADRPVSAGGVAERPVSAGGVAERPVPGGGVAERPVSAGGSGERPVPGGGVAERPVSAGGSGERPVPGGGVAERPVSAGGSGARAVSAGGSADRVVSAGGSGDLPVSAGGSGDLPVSAGGSGDRVVPGGGSGERPVPGGGVAERVVPGGGSAEQVVSAGGVAVRLVSYVLSSDGPFLAAVVMAVVVHAGAAAGAVLDRGTSVPGWAVAGGAVVVALAVAGAAVRVGSLRGRRDRADRGAREERLAVWTEEAVRDAWAERRRIAGGLETTVLARTADMVAEAEAGRLDGTADRAREALAAMRALLDTVRENETAPALRPQPTLQALDLLAAQCRATGREVEIRLTGRVPDRLPTAVDLTAYHAAETLLAVGGEEPALLELDTDGATLTLTATGVPLGARPAVRERLTARIAALGGTLTTEASGPVGLRLPLAPAAEQGEEKRER